MVRDRATRNDSRLSPRMDDAVALFRDHGASVEDICAKLGLWPLKVLKFLVADARPLLSPESGGTVKDLWRLVAGDPWALLDLAAPGLAPAQGAHLRRVARELVRFELEERKYAYRAREYATICGAEYEAVLYARMRNLGLHFKTEQELR